MRNPLSSRERSRSIHHILLMVVTLMTTGCLSVPRFESSQRSADRFFDSSTPPVFDDDHDIASDSSRSSGMKTKRSRSAKKRAEGHLPPGLLAAPRPFEWQAAATTAGRRDIECVEIGQGGYRVLVIGSLAGNDPLAIRLTESLAQNVHKNQIVLGGMRLKVIRNGNPDGHAELRMENSNGVYLNRQFHQGIDVRRDLAKQEPEIRFLLGCLDEDRPQRIIHLRTTSNERGIIAASSGAAGAAKDFSRWQDFRFVSLPGKSASGTLERYISLKNDCEIITIAIPDSEDSELVWQTYGDSLMNLLLAEDFDTRELARQQKNSVAADRRGRKDDGLGD